MSHSNYNPADSKRPADSKYPITNTANPAPSLKELADLGYKMCSLTEEIDYEQDDSDFVETPFEINHKIKIKLMQTVAIAALTNTLRQPDFLKLVEKIFGNSLFRYTAESELLMNDTVLICRILQETWIPKVANEAAKELGNFGKYFPDNAYLFQAMSELLERQLVVFSGSTYTCYGKKFPSFLAFYEKDQNQFVFLTLHKFAVNEDIPLTSHAPKETSVILHDTNPKLSYDPFLNKLGVRLNTHLLSFFDSHELSNLSTLSRSWHRNTRLPLRNISLDSFLNRYSPDIDFFQFGIASALRAVLQSIWDKDQALFFQIRNFIIECAEEDLILREPLEDKSSSGDQKQVDQTVAVVNPSVDIENHQRLLQWIVEGNDAKFVKFAEENSDFNFTFLLEYLSPRLLIRLFPNERILAVLNAKQAELLPSNVNKPKYVCCSFNMKSTQKDVRLAEAICDVIDDASLARDNHYIVHVAIFTAIGRNLPYKPILERMAQRINFSELRWDHDGVLREVFENNTSLIGKHSIEMLDFVLEKGFYRHLFQDNELAHEGHELLECTAQMSVRLLKPFFDHYPASCDTRINSDDNSRSPLINFANLDCVSFLIERGARIDDKRTIGFGPHFIRPRNIEFYSYTEYFLQHQKAVQGLLLLSRYPNYIFNRQINGFLSAAIDNCYNLLNIFHRDEKQYIKTKDSNHNTALHLAIDNHAWLAAKILLEFTHLPVNMRNASGHTPLDLCLFQFHTEDDSTDVDLLSVTEKLIAHPDSVLYEPNQLNITWNRLLNLSVYLDRLLLLALEHKKVPFDSIGHQMRDWSLMHFAAAHNLIRVSQFLLRNGMKGDAEDALGTTPFEIAFRNNNTELRDLLLAHTSPQTITAIYIKMISGNNPQPEMIRILISHLPDSFKPDDEINQDIFKARDQLKLAEAALLNNDAKSANEHFSQARVADIALFNLHIKNLLKSGLLKDQQKAILFSLPALSRTEDVLILIGLGIYWQQQGEPLIAEAFFRRGLDVSVLSYEIRQIESFLNILKPTSDKVADAKYDLEEIVKTLNLVIDDEMVINSSSLWHKPHYADAVQLKLFLANTSTAIPLRKFILNMHMEIIINGGDRNSKFVSALRSAVDALPFVEKMEHSVRFTLPGAVVRRNN